MIDNGYIYMKDNKRIFINTTLGCSGKCKYCYLPNIGYNKKKHVSAKYIIDTLKKKNINANTLITLGCYSECLDKHNKQETIKLIKYFLKKGNQIQLSTKKRITKKDINYFKPFIKYYGQLIIFVSTATISEQKIIEEKTTPIIKRLKNFKLSNKYNIPFILYIKPVLANTTIKDLNMYIYYIKKYKIKSVVVGSLFTSKISNETVPFSNKKELFYTKNNDEDIIYNKLSKITNIYRRSTEVMHKYNIK